MRKRLSGIQRFEVYKFIKENPEYVTTLTAAELADSLLSKLQLDVSVDSARQYAKECGVDLRNSRSGQTGIKEQLLEIQRTQAAIVSDLERIKRFLNMDGIMMGSVVRKEDS